MADGISAHGTIVKRNGTAIAELAGITPPALMRNDIELTVHNDNQDAYTLGIRRREPMTLSLNFVPSLGTHDHLTGLIKAHTDKSVDLYVIEYPDGSEYTFSGLVSNIAPDAPVDEKLSAEVTIRPTGGDAFA